MVINIFDYGFGESSGGLTKTAKLFKALIFVVVGRVTNCLDWRFDGYSGWALPRSASIILRRAELDRLPSPAYTILRGAELDRGFTL